ncbi:hypothetical protein BJX70DRAFT_261863 [Aspergillus crustosus]
MNNQLNVQGTFNPSLRDHSSWAVIGPILTASSAIAESRVSTASDFVFQQGANRPSLQALLLAPSSLEAHQQANTSLQLREFADSAELPTVKKAIAFLLSEDAFTSASGKSTLNGLLGLQVLQFENLVSHLPVIPVPDAPSFISSIEEYMANFADMPINGPSLSDTVALLAPTTSDYPNSLCQQTTNVLSDLFPSFRALSQKTRTREGQELLVDNLGEDMAGNIVKFWNEDILR